MDAKKGLDGCFIKLTTGQQILAATGRDGNNNIFPIACGIVDKEDTDSWTWFLYQLKIALGGQSGKFGNYTIISDRQKAKLQPEDFVDDFFKKPMYLAAYSPIIYLVPGPDMWPRTDSLDIEAPVFKEHKGRAQTKRRKGQFEKPAPKDTSRMASITCSNCKKVGHRYTNCHDALKPALAMRKNKHQPSTSSYPPDSRSTPAPARTAASAVATAGGSSRRATSAASPAPARRATSATSPAPARRATSAAAPARRQPAAPAAPKGKAAASKSSSSAPKSKAPVAPKGKAQATRSSSAAAKGPRLAFMPPRPNDGSQRARKPSNKMKDYLTASGAKWYTNCHDALKPALAMRKNKHQPSTRSYPPDSRSTPAPASTAASAAATAGGSSRRATSAASPAPARTAASAAATAGGSSRRATSAASPAPARTATSAASPAPARRATSAAAPKGKAAASKSSSSAPKSKAPVAPKGKAPATRSSSAAAKGPRLAFMPPRPSDGSQRARKPSNRMKDYLTASGAK
nr:skin secretory protein xP2-like [Aegilops tauschii subsp. strangulata]